MAERRVPTKACQKAQSWLQHLCSDKGAAQVFHLPLALCPAVSLVFSVAWRAISLTLAWRPGQASAAKRATVGDHVSAASASLVDLSSEFNSVLRPVNRHVTKPAKPIYLYRFGIILMVHFSIVGTAPLARLLWQMP
jgi:hypothetical protein